MRIVDGQICYNDKGVHAIENYLMSRYHMYWQIYYHPVARSYEIILESIYKRIKDMIKTAEILSKPFSLNAIITTSFLGYSFSSNNFTFSDIFRFISKNTPKL